MFKSRSPFYPPTVPGQDYRKSVQELQQRGKRNMSIQQPTQQKKNEKREKSRERIPLHLSAKQLAEYGASVVDEKYFMQIRQPYKDADGNTPDPTLYWYTILSDQLSGEYLRRIIFREQQYFVRSNTSDPYQTIYLCIDGIDGYKNAKSQYTTRVCTLQLTAISTILDDSGQKVWDLLYRQIGDVVWDIPNDLNEIKLRIQYDDGNVSTRGNLGVPMTCQFDVRHFAR